MFETTLNNMDAARMADHSCERQNTIRWQVKRDQSWRRGRKCGICGDDFETIELRRSEYDVLIAEIARLRHLEDFASRLANFAASLKLNK